MSLTFLHINLNIKERQRYGRARARSEPDTMCWATRTMTSLLLDIKSQSENAMRQAEGVAYILSLLLVFHFCFLIHYM